MILVPSWLEVLDIHIELGFVRLVNFNLPVSQSSTPPTPPKTPALRLALSLFFDVPDAQDLMMALGESEVAMWHRHPKYRIRILEPGPRFTLNPCRHLPCPKLNSGYMNKDEGRKVQDR